MNRKEIEREERYYNQFNKEGSIPRDNDETHAFSIYALIRHQVRNAKVPKYNKSELVNRMTGKMEEGRERLFFFPHTGFRIPRFLTETVYAGILLVCLYICTQTLIAIDTDLIESIHFENGNNQELPVPTLWKYRLSGQRNVTVPNEVRTRINLSDGTILECQGGTHIAILFNERRKVYMGAGKLTVHAAKNLKKPMTITTPLAEIHVVGTEFTIELSQ